MLRGYPIDTATIPMWAYMVEVVFATSLHVGICRMSTTLFGDDVAQESVIRILC